MMGGLPLPAASRPNARPDRALDGPVDAPARQSAARTAGASLTTERQIAYWRRSGLVRPGGSELAQARAIAALRRAGISLPRIRAAADRLRESWSPGNADAPGFEPFCDGSALPDGPPMGLFQRAEASAHRPLAGGDGERPAETARFTVLAGELFIRHPDGAWEGDRQPGQLILDGILPLPGAPVADDVQNPTAYRGTEYGRTARPPGLTEGREVILWFLGRENARPQAASSPRTPAGPPDRRFTATRADASGRSAPDEA